MKQALPFSIFFLFLCGCQNTPPLEFEQQALQLEQQVVEIECRKMQLKHQIDSIWGATTSAIEKELPRDMEAGAKENLLSLKAEHLIKMLPEYNDLNSNTKALISEASTLDSTMTLQFAAVLKEYNAYEVEMKKFLQAVETKSAPMRMQYLKRLQNAQREACKEK